MITTTIFSNTVNIVRATLGSAEVSNLFITPLTLIQGPGAILMPFSNGFYIDVIKATARLNFKTTAYTGIGSLLLQYGSAAPSASNQIANDAQILLSTATNTRAMLWPTGATESGDVGNQVVSVACTGAMPAGGDGTLDIWVYFSINSN